MSKLTDFYTHKAALNEQNDPRWEQMEDQLLKEELLPEIIDHLKTVLSKVKSPLVFSGSYDPNGVLSVSITRNCLIANDLARLNFHDKTPQPIVSPYSILDPDRPIRKKAKSIGFSVAFPDGTTICEDKAVSTFIKALQKIGLNRINSDSRCPIHSGYLLVDSRENTDERNTQHYVDGYYIYTKLSNDSKKADLNALSDHFGLDLKIRNA